MGVYASLRARARHWPEMRAAARSWPVWIVRQLLAPFWSLPVVLTSRHGVRCAMGDDPIDDAVFRHVHGPGASLYFPDTGIDVKGFVLDVGAHHGIYAMEALRRYPACRVIAVEPDPAACRRIRANAELNHASSRIEIVQAGLAAHSGEGWLEPSPRGSWGHRTRPADTGRDPAVGIPIELKSLESILAGSIACGPHPGLLRDPAHAPVRA